METKGHLIKHLMEKVLSASFTNMEDALNFVDWLDGELSTLVRLVYKLVIVTLILKGKIPVYFMI